MRLIDADALVAQEEFFAKTFKGDFGELVATHVIEIVNDAPTVDAVPVWFIREQINELSEAIELSGDSNGGYVSSTDYRLWELEDLLKEWAERKEE